MGLRPAQMAGRCLQVQFDSCRDASHVHVRLFNPLPQFSRLGTCPLGSILYVYFVLVSGMVSGLGLPFFLPYMHFLS